MKTKTRVPGAGRGILLAVCAVVCAVAVRAENGYVEGTNDPAHDASFVWQARLKTADGAAIAGSNDVTFALWDAATDGRMLWARVVPVVSDGTGLFSVTLSDGAGRRPPEAVHPHLDDALVAAEAVYLGVTVGTGAEIRPRLRVASVPFAGTALNVSAARGDFAAEETFAATELTAGDASVLGQVSARTASVSGELRVAGDLNMLEGLDVKAGTTAFRADLAVAGNLTVTGTSTLGAATVQDAARVAGTATVDSLTVAGDFLVDGVNAALPAGVIICWNGDAKNLPRDWEICDGTHGTPDLRDYFVPAAGSSYGLGDVGGSDTVRLEARHLPSHSHTITFHTYGYAGSHNTSSEVTGRKWNCNAATVASGSTGGNGAHENRPPYYALFYIMKVR